MSGSRLEILDLCKTYGNGNVIAVDGINLSIAAGETLALLGPSGCGKSTTLNMIVGLEQPTSGDIQVDGKSILGLSAGQRDIGLVFQDYAVFTSMTVRKNLAFGLEVRKLDSRTITHEVEAMAELIGMKDKLEAKVRNLGGSELQRVAIGRTLLTKPSILLLDEPLSNLETSTRLVMRQELRRLQHELGLTIIYVTHDQVEALSLADSIAVMSHGKIVQTEKTAMIVESPGHVQVAEFLGSPPMNTLFGNFVHENGNMVFKHYNFSFVLPGWSLPEQIEVENRNKMYHLAFRAEDLAIVEEKDGMFAGGVAEVEARGYDSIVSVDVNGKMLKSVVPYGRSIREGEKVGLRLRPESLALFDGITNLRIAARFAGRNDG